MVPTLPTLNLSKREAIVLFPSSPEPMELMEPMESTEPVFALKYLDHLSLSLESLPPPTGMSMEEETTIEVLHHIEQELGELLNHPDLKHYSQFKKVIHDIQWIQLKLANPPSSH
ncbi:hypothetical protein M231_04906 [Tremella mesenterica]|uniref:Uncharacterized protein n=1 Tax=Tremella mesenterica TaxID=5217 RepID=A0A4Q1BJK2_TREME|nr:hypothetical protein M231_04906 [Tremella mesenterica]